MIGIDDMAFYVPEFYLDIETLSTKRDIPYLKLKKGLGLNKMAIPNSNEDAATMAANAVKDLIERNNIPVHKIGRIYVGTESAFDGAKPIASYVLGMLEDYFGDSDGFRNTDVVDFTFACIGGVDAVLNTLDWIRADEDRIGIVVSSDNAKYELNSPGEYTQGAGAVALLLKSNPRILSIDTKIGIACKSVHDFFKPLRTPTDSDEDYAKIHLDTPIYDGHFSNICYTERLKEAYRDFKYQVVDHELKDWDRVIFHLPYAFHGKRIFAEIVAGESSKSGGNLSKEAIKEIYKSENYQQFVTDKIEKGQRASSEIGNMYTASIWMSLMSTLSSDLENEENFDQIGFCAYGSGSKAKVFHGQLQEGWKKVVSSWNLFGSLKKRQAIDFQDYENLHKTRFSTIYSTESKFVLDEIQKAPLYGQRKYRWLSIG